MDLEGTDQRHISSSLNPQPPLQPLARYEAYIFGSLLLELRIGIRRLLTDPWHHRPHKNAADVASPSTTGEQRPEFKNTPKDCSRTVQLKPKLFFFSSSMSRSLGEVRESQSKKVPTI